MIKAIIFDMDGVLIDSEPYYQDVLLHLLHSLEINATANDLIPLAGGTTKHHDQVINPLIQGVISREDFNHYIDSYYLHHPVPYPKILFPHVKEILEWIKNHGYRIAIASSSKKYEIQNVLELCNIENYFEIIMSGDMFQESKPNPEIYITCAEKLNLNPNECIAIEDSEYGITAAKSANMTCIAKRDLRFQYNQNNADYLIDDLIEIQKILEVIT